MKYKKFTRALISIFLANSLYISQSIGDEPQKPQAMIDYIKSLDKPIELRGDYLKAAMIAYNEDFSKFIEEYKRQSETNENAEKNTLHLVFLSKLENYDVLIELKGKDYAISFGPTVRGDTVEIFGGGAQYLIDGNTFKIKEKKYSK